MKKPTHKRTLKELFEFTEDTITEPYEVVRTIGFTLKCKSGVKDFRLEAVKRPGERLFSVVLWSRRRNAAGFDGAWEGGSTYEEPTLRRVHPDLALRSMVTYMHQHRLDF